jgi:hypothetical protein
LRLAGRVPDRKKTIRILCPKGQDRITKRSGLFFAHGLQSGGSSTETGLIAVQTTTMQQHNTSSKNSTRKSINQLPPQTSKVLPEGRKNLSEAQRTPNP